MARKELRYYKHTVITLKYRVKVLVGDVALVVEEIIRKPCEGTEIEIIDTTVNANGYISVRPRCENNEGVTT